MEKEGEVYYRKYAFPGWTASVDGKRVEITKGKPFSQVAIDVPKGKHRVKVVYRETPRNVFLDLLSLFSLITALLIIVKSEKK